MPPKRCIEDFAQFLAPAKFNFAAPTESFSLDLDSAIFQQSGESAGAAKGDKPHRPFRKSHHPLISVHARRQPAGNVEATYYQLFIPKVSFIIEATRTARYKKNPSLNPRPITTVKYYIHLDEAGDFGDAVKRLSGKKKTDASVVGGTCSRLYHNGWESAHKDLIWRFNQDHGTDFRYLDHFHCSQVIMGSVPGGSPAPEALRRQFAEDVFHDVLRHAIFGLISINNRARFEFSRQATYGVNLVAVLKAGLLHLAQEIRDCDALEIVIAQRSIGETRTSPSDAATYMQDLLPFLKAQLLTGHDAGVLLLRRLSETGGVILRPDRAKFDAGLMAADFICLARTESHLRSELAVRTAPDDIFFGDYEAFYEVEVRRLIESQQYAAAFSIASRCILAPKAARETPRIFDALRTENDPEILGRELPALLAEARMLIEKRTLETDALAAARQILESLFTIAEVRLSSSETAVLKRRWADLLISGLTDLAACHNHAGETEPQRRIEQALDRALEEYGGLVSTSYHQRKEILLEARTRNLNILFNDYRFGEVIDSFEKEVRQREGEIPGSMTDELLGQMLGSLGQACAFLARTDAGWAPMAKDYFERSKRHFAPGTRYHSMSVNYLATLAFQQRQVDQSCREMSEHKSLPPIESAEALLGKFHQFVSHENASAFDATNYLRIASLCVEQGMPLDRNSVDVALNYWRPRIQNAHPFEQLCKWFAYLLYRGGEPARASDICERGIPIFRSLGFTVQTIGLSLLGLNALCRASLSDHQGYMNNRHSLSVLATKLAGQSTAFDAYLQNFGGPQGLLTIVDKRNAEGAREICRFLPFAYM